MTDELQGAVGEVVVRIFGEQLLHAVLADMVKAERDGVVDGRRVNGFGSGKKGDVLSFSAGSFRGLGDALVDQLIIVFDITK